MLFDTKPTGTGTSGNQDGQSAEQKFNTTDTLKSIGSGLGDIVSSNLNIFGDAITKLTEAMDTFETQVSRLALSFGGTRDLANSIRQSIADATPSVVELGGSMDDVVKIQSGVIKGLQTQTILNKEAYAELFAVAKLTTDGTKDTGVAVGDMIKKFSDAGYGLYNVGQQMTGIIGKAKEFGVTTVALMAELEKGISKLNLYNFSNGIQGMASMAAQAASLRIDMGNTLKVADELFNPDKAFEMAASFQRLGVQVTSLLDPYKLMDMARNDPAKLQESIIEATKSLTYFDEKNQRMAILPGAQGQLRELAAAMNIPVEQLATMAVNAGDLDRKMREIKFNPEFADDKSQKMVASMAQLKDGKYMVTFDDEKGNSITKAVEDLNKADKERLEQMATQDPAKTAVDLQKDANGVLRSIDNSLKAMRGVIPTQLAASTTLNNAIQKFGNVTQAGIEATQRSVLGFERGKRGELSIDKTKKGVQEMGTSIGQIMSDIITKGKAPSLSDITALAEPLQKNGMFQLENFSKFYKETLTKQAESQGKKFEDLYDEKSFDKVVETLNKGFQQVGIGTIKTTSSTTPTTPAPTANTTQPVTTTTPTAPTTVAAPTSNFDLLPGYTSMISKINPTGQPAATTTITPESSIVDIANTISNDYKTNLDVQNQSLTTLKSIDKNTAQTPVTIQNKTLTDLTTSITDGNILISDIQNKILTSSQSIEKNTQQIVPTDMVTSMKTLTDLVTNKLNKPTPDLATTVNKVVPEIKLPDNNLAIKSTTDLTNAGMNKPATDLNTTNTTTGTEIKVPDINTTTAAITPNQQNVTTGNIAPNEPQVVTATVTPIAPPEIKTQNIEPTTASVTNNIPINVTPTININGQGLSKEEVKSIVTQHFDVAYQNIQEEVNRKTQAKGYSSSYKATFG